MKYSEQISFRWYQHLVFWLAFVAFWSIRDLIHHPVYIDNFQLNLVSTSIYAIVVYFNVYFLVPRYLLARRYLLYLTFLAMAIVAIGLATTQAISNYLAFFGHQEASNFFSSTRGVVVIQFEALFITLITLSIILVKINVIKDNTTQELIKKNLESELGFLKNQINPHFLFNSLNSIYFLIPKNPKKAAEVLLKFSNMLSHQLHEVKRDLIALEDEIKYMENYIELEKIRQGERVKVQWSVQGEVNGQLIAPMIFLTFLENAFKHGQQTPDSTYEINGLIKVTADSIRFSLKNDCAQCNYPDEDIKGVGLENTRRRLELLYPEKHHLSINNSNGSFAVEVTIEINED